jgi:BMFP domain-containing protein YqiC
METIGTIEEVYSRVMDVIIKNIGSTTEDVEKQILNFM